MFNAPFSFNGRIRRSEYALSSIIYGFLVVLLNAIINSVGSAILVIFVAIPLSWFFWAQGAKRSHDIGNSGWWQLIPFYCLWLMFKEGQPGKNIYGENPKGIKSQSQQSLEEPEGDLKKYLAHNNYKSVSRAAEISDYPLLEELNLISVLDQIVLDNPKLKPYEVLVAIDNIIPWKEETFEEPDNLNMRRTKRIEKYLNSRIPNKILMNSYLNFKNDYDGMINLEKEIFDFLSNKKP